jgi:hypothetical protein
MDKFKPFWRANSEAHKMRSADAVTGVTMAQVADRVNFVIGA